MWGSKKTEEPAKVTTPAVNPVYKQADELHMAEKYSDAFDLMKKTHQGGNQEADCLWRLGRAHYLMGEESTDKAVKKEHYFTGFDFACKQALDKEPENWAAHKWCGITQGSLGPFQSINDKIKGSFTIRDHFLKAAELNPNDATTQHTLGKWCQAIVGVSWVERKAASALFSTPPSCDYEQMEKYYLRSEELAPNQVNNQLALGDMYKERKMTDEAKKWYTGASQCEVFSESGRRQVQEAKDKLAKL